MGNEELYLEATNEVERDEQDPALWAMVMALAEGDKHNAKYQYIKLRVEQLRQYKEKIITKAAPDKRFKTKTVSVQKYAKEQNMPLDKVLELIHDNKLDGYHVGDAWYVKVEDSESNTTRSTDSVNQQSHTMNESLQYIKAAKLIDFLAWFSLVFGVLVTLFSLSIVSDFKINHIYALVFLIVLPVFMFYISNAIKEHKIWGRNSGIVLGILYLFGFPIGTVVGAYILWKLIWGWEIKDYNSLKNG